MAAAIRIAGRAATALTVLVAIVAVGFLIVAPRLIGGASLAVLTGSMSPAIPAGSVVLIRPVEDPSAIPPGTVVTFQKSPAERVLITHRVVRYQPDTTPPSYITKGDANRGEDVDPVAVGAIRGEVVRHVPHLGRLSSWLGGPRGPYLFGLALGVLFIIAQARRLVAAIKGPDLTGRTDAPPPDQVDTPPLVPAGPVRDGFSRRPPP